MLVARRSLCRHGGTSAADDETEKEALGRTSKTLIYTAYTGCLTRADGACYGRGCSSRILAFMGLEQQTPKVAAHDTYRQGSR